jgi:alpha-galactosidase
VIRGGTLSIELGNDGSYALRSAAIDGVVVRSGVEVELAGTTLRSSMYPRHVSTIATFHDEFGGGSALTVKHTGLTGMPDLVSVLRVRDTEPWGDLQASVVNSTSKPIEVRAVRVVRSEAGAVGLGGPDGEDRILSDSFSEDTPQLRLMDLGEPSDGVHRAVGSQLVYNRKSGMSFFIGALSADRLLTVFHLKSSGKGTDARVVSLDVMATGTNEVLRDETEHGYPAGNNVLLALRVAPGESLGSERLMFAIGQDYHQQLENYGRAIRILHKARVNTATPIGWWSWTAFYYGVTEGTSLANAAWLAQNLEPLGYKYFQIDEGYQYARGEYSTADGRAFPRGMGYVGDRVRSQGLTFGVWVAPFEVSERSWVYEHHPEWLVRTREGQPVHIGKIGTLDELYALDTTHPGAQEYLRSTYQTLVKEWGVRFIKMDFMDAAAVEGVRYRPETTALEAQRIGLETIRAAVGEDVVLDKDGSPMLTPVGVVDAGRTSQDTGHTFESTRDAASGIAARYYMNRNFYVTDPDAFTVSEQTIPDRVWHGNKLPLTLDEAEASIALSAVSGGMFEIGDDLPTLGASAERVALTRNGDLLDMAKLGRASVPLDLMTYRTMDLQPSVFLLKESKGQRILTVFNWTNKPRTHVLTLSSLGLNGNGSYMASDVLRNGVVPIRDGAITISQPGHSVRMVKLVDTSVREDAPLFDTKVPSKIGAGETVVLSASAREVDLSPVLTYRWDFGDGISAEGAQVSHVFTRAGQYAVVVRATGLNGVTTEQKFNTSVLGIVPTAYDPASKERYRGPN